MFANVLARLFPPCNPSPRVFPLHILGYAVSSENNLVYGLPTPSKWPTALAKRHLRLHRAAPPHAEAPTRARRPPTPSATASCRRWPSSAPPRALPRPPSPTSSPAPGSRAPPSTG